VRRGELSNEVLPRLFIVFEGLVGILPDTKAKTLESVARKRKKWAQAVDYYLLNTGSTVRGMRDLYWRHRFRVDVITFIDPAFVIPVQNKLDSHNLRFGDVHFYDRGTLLDDLTYDPSIIRVLDPDPMRSLAWGGKGSYCDPSQLDLMRLIT